MLFGNHVGNVIDRNKDQVFAITPPIALDFLTRMVQTLMKRDTYFVQSLEVFQSKRSFLLSKTMPMVKRTFFERCIGSYLEYGHSKKFFRTNPPNLGINFASRGEFNHYSDLQTYIEKHTRIEALSFDKLDYLFRIYYALLVLILLANFAHYYYLKMIDIEFKFGRIRILLCRIKRELIVFTIKLYIFFSLKASGWFASKKFQLSSFLFVFLRRIKLRR